MSNIVKMKKEKKQMYCEHCGAEIADNSTFCVVCGKPVSNGGVQQPRGGQNQAGTQNMQFQGNAQAGNVNEGKKGEPLIEQVFFDSYASAQAEKVKAESKVKRIQIGLIIAAVAEVFYILGYLLRDTNVGLYFHVLGYPVAIAAYNVGGGILTALKHAWKLSKTIGWIGWVCVPFPADIFTGLMLTAFAIMLLPIGLLWIPLIYVFLNYKQNKANLEAAEQYLMYCTPNNNVQPM